MNKIVSFLFICLLLADLHAQNTIKIIDKDKTSTPVSPYLWGSFFEMGFGRSDLLWGELLFNRSFENTKPVKLLVHVLPGGCKGSQVVAFRL